MVCRMKSAKISPLPLEKFFKISIPLHNEKLFRYHYGVRRKFHQTPPLTPSTTGIEKIYFGRRTP